MSTENPIESIWWWHTIDLGNGVVTKGYKNTPEEVAKWKIPADFFTGKEVLDVGSWDGFYSFYAEQHGAKRVVAVDTKAWQKNGGAGKAGFNIARATLKSKVEDVECTIADLDFRHIGTFDRIIFAGILYHMPDPLLALRRASECLKIGGRILLETHFAPISPGIACMEFLGSKILGNDPTNFWQPNEQCVREMLELVGFQVDSVFTSYPTRLVVYATKIAPVQYRLEVSEQATVCK